MNTVLILKEYCWSYNDVSFIICRCCILSPETFIFIYKNNKLLGIKEQCSLTPYCIKSNHVSTIFYIFRLYLSIF